MPQQCFGFSHTLGYSPATSDAGDQREPRMTLQSSNELDTLLLKLRDAVDNKTKPPGSLGRIEELAIKIGLVQGTSEPEMSSCQLTIFAADHGIAADGVSAFPQEVTQQMVLNFLNGGAAANVFSNTLGINLQVVDAGIVGDPIDHARLLDRRIAPGTRNFRHVAAMNREQLDLALDAGRRIGTEGSHDAVCFGEMGIANTSAAALLCHKMLGIALENLVGRGTGVTDTGLDLKGRILKSAAARTADKLSATDAMTEYGGFEIVMMAGAMQGAATSGKVVLVDGFIATAAAIAAMEIEPSCKDNLVFAHQSAERGHAAVLERLNIRPLLALDLRLGEGTGAMLAWPLLRSAAAMLSDMASFDSAGVSGRQ